MTDVTLPLRVLMVGAGRRVQNNFLPVLRALSDRFTVLGVHARTLANLQPVADTWEIPAIHSLNGPEVETADVVAISVPTAQNAIVLKALLPYASRLTIVIDTPIAWNRRELADTTALLEKFNRVLVTEDYMNFPAFALVRQAVAQNLIGIPKALTLTNIGYLYHGLALIRSFIGFRPATSTWRRKVGTLSKIVGYQFADGFQACVIGPYRRLVEGGLMLEGSDGIITQFLDDLPRSSAARPVYLLSPAFSNGYLTGYTIAAGDTSLSHFPSELVAMRDMPFADKSELNLQRGCGLASVFKSLLGQDDPITALNLSYGPRNAFYDGFASRLAERGRYPFDPFTWIGRDVLTAIHTLNRWLP